jgi:hypothetical protein
MPLNIGDPAPAISGTDVVHNQPWSLQNQAEKFVLLAFSGVTWCGPCQLEAPALQELWEMQQGNANFSMAIISGKFGEAETPQSLQTQIAQFGFTFPVVPAHTSWPDYEITAVPTLCCLQWDEVDARYEVAGVHVGAMTDAHDILDFLHDSGLTELVQPPLGHWEAVFIHLFGGVAQGGGGWGITPGGKPIPIPGNPLRHLGKAGRDALMGLAIAEMSGRFGDAELKMRVRNTGVGVAKESLARLEAQQSSMTRSVALKELSAWGADRMPAAKKAA